MTKTRSAFQLPSWEKLQSLVYGSGASQSEQAKRKRRRRRAALNEIGSRLREAREYRHLTLAAASLATRITAKHLTALEAGDLKSLPGSTYTRAFLRTYASYLALDPDEMIALLPEQVEKPTQGFPKPPDRPRISLLFWSTVAVLLFALSCIGWNALLASFRQESTPASVSVLDAPTPRAVAGIIDSQPPTPTATPAPSVRIQVRATDRVQLSVSVDGTERFAGTLEAGDNRNWEGYGIIRLHTPNGAAIDVTFNGDRRGPLGRRNEVVDIEWASPPTPGPSGTRTPQPTPTATMTPTPVLPTPTGERPR